MSSTAVTAGSTLIGTSIAQISQNMKTWRNVTIQISNHSKKYTLADPQVHTISGYCFHPPQPTIEKSTKEVCCFSKTAGVAHGAVGVLTYQVLTNDKNCVGDLAIMFSVPFDYNLFDNWFALGIFEADLVCDDTGTFNRSKSTGSILSYSKKGICVKGTMSAGGQSIMKVEMWDE